MATHTIHTYPIIAMTLVYGHLKKSGQPYKSHVSILLFLSISYTCTYKQHFLEIKKKYLTSKNYVLPTISSDNPNSLESVPFECS